MVSHSVAMLIACHKSELAELPTAGEQWQWGTVVDLHATGDGVSRSVAQRACQAGIIEAVGDGEYVTSRRFQEYLAEKHGIELTARRDDDQFNPPENQAACPSTRESPTNQES